MLQGLMLLSLIFHTSVINAPIICNYSNQGDAFKLIFIKFAANKYSFKVC